MKTFTSIAIAFFLVLACVPAMAADQAGSDREPVTLQALESAPLTFQALSKLPAMEREAITPLTDTELATIEGSVDICVVCLNIAVITQTNVNTGNATGVGIGGYHGNGTGVGIIDQSNYANVHQSIN
jgi:hypothetical protein